MPYSTLLHKRLCISNPGFFPRVFPIDDKHQVIYDTHFFYKQYLSGKGIVHRDLAARNVLVCDNKLVKVADFGLARNTLGDDAYHRTGQHNKLPLKWMSPEAICDGVFTTKSDV